MPLLRKETEVFPDDLFSAANPGAWRVAHVRSRQEKVLARYLHQHAVPYYLPQIEQRRHRAGRVFKSYSPLFPGYVFFHAVPNSTEALWRSGVTANLIDVREQDVLDAELRQIRDLQLSGASLRRQVEIVPGDVVRIDEGAFRGYVGVVERSKGTERLLVKLSLLNAAVTVEFSREMVNRRRA